MIFITSSLPAFEFSSQQSVKQKSLFGHEQCLTCGFLAHGNSNNDNIYSSWNKLLSNKTINST